MPDDEFLGRSYDVNTATWRYSDGNGGAVPDEIRHEMNIRLSRNFWPVGNFLYVYAPLWEWRKRQKQQTL